MKCFVMVLVLGLGAASLQCQATPSSRSGREVRNQRVELPTTTLDFSHAVALSGIPQSPFIVEPLQCSPKGTAFIRVPLPPKFMTQSLISVTKDGKAAIKVSGGNPPGFDHFSLTAYFPGDKGIYALGQGWKHAPGEVGGFGQSRPHREQVILKYGEDGSLDSVIRLHISFTPFRFAVLPSGRFIVIGQSYPDNAPVLDLLDRDGENPRLLDLFGSGLYGSGSLRQHYSGQRYGGPGESAMSRALGAVQFVSYGDDVLLVQMGSDFPVAVIGDAGILRTVRLALPAGNTIESFVPSTKPFFYVRTVDDSTNPVTHKLIVFDPDTGQALRQISITGLTSPESIACGAGDTFLGFRKVFKKEKKGYDGGTWNLLTASD